jgi:hypothetical protein
MTILIYIQSSNTRNEIEIGKTTREMVQSWLFGVWCLDRSDGTIVFDDRVVQRYRREYDIGRGKGVMQWP